MVIPSKGSLRGVREQFRGDSPRRASDGDFPRRFVLLLDLTRFGRLLHAADSRTTGRLGGGAGPAEPGEGRPDAAEIQGRGVAPYVGVNGMHEVVRAAGMAQSQSVARM